MGILVDNEVTFLEENGAEISLLTATDHLNYLHHFNLNRSNGNVSVVRFHESGKTRREISIFKCKTSSINLTPIAILLRIKCLYIISWDR